MSHAPEAGDAQGTGMSSTTPRAVNAAPDQPRLLPLHPPGALRPAAARGTGSAGPACFSMKKWVLSALTPRHVCIPGGAGAPLWERDPSRVEGSLAHTNGHFHRLANRHHNTRRASLCLSESPRGCPPRGGGMAGEWEGPAVGRDPLA